jgi:outer membrane protein
MLIRSRSRHLLLASGLAVLAVGAARGATLGEAMALAYQSNPTLQAQRATQRALDESYVQAMANYRPQITVQSAVTDEINNASSVGATSRLPGHTETNTNSVQITQPLYTGGRVAAAVSAAVAGVLSGRETLRAAEETTLQNVVQVYVDVRRDQESVEIAQENDALLQRQLEESHARFAVGDITRTDVAQTQTRVSAARAQLASARATLATSRATYLSVVGENPGKLEPEPSLAKLLPVDIDKALDMAEQNNPHIGEADYAEQASAAKVAAAKAQTRPSVSLQATLGYYGGSTGTQSFFGPSPAVTPFTDYSRDITASATASFPLFSGGYYSSQIRQAAETNNVDRINIETTRRQVLLTVSQAWNQLVGARASLAADKEQVEAANIAFEGTRQEARVGLRTTLDVLISEQDLADAQLALVGARHDEYFAAAALLAAMGSLEAADFAPDLEVYDPRSNFDRVRGANAMPWDGLVHALDKLAAPKIVERPATVRVDDGAARADGGP